MKKLISILVFIISVTFQTGISSAQTFKTFLDAGSSTIWGGLDVDHTLDQGYVCTGISGIYSNYDRGEYRSLEGHVSIGDDILIEGLTGELGIKGLIGSVDKGFGNSDLGNLAFMARGAYLFPRDVFPINTTIFSELTWTPGPLAFIDMDRYYDFKAGVDLFLVERAALEFAYIHYSIKMEEDSHYWTDRQDVALVGIKLNF